MVPSFLGTKTTGLAHSADVGSMTLARSMRSISFFSFSHDEYGSVGRLIDRPRTRLQFDAMLYGVDLT